MSRDQLANTARIIAYLLLSAVTILAAYLLIFGQEVHSIAETPVNSDQQTPPLEEQVSHVPYPQAAGYLAAAGLMLAGLAERRLLALAWIGLALLFVMSGLFLFSSGALFLPFAGALMVLLIAIQWAQPASGPPASGPDAGRGAES